ncbi:unknown [Oscillibacter sp. CAG:241]|nr:unknown [Oscillibacter sp. CAG:241]
MAGGGDDLALLHGLAAGLAHLIAGVAVLGAGGSHSAHNLGIVAGSRDDLTLLHGLAAGLAHLIAGIAVLGAGGGLGTHNLGIVAGSGDDLRLDGGIGLLLKGHSSRVGADTVRGAGGRRGDLVGDHGVLHLNVRGIIGADEGRSGALHSVPAPHGLAPGVAGGGDHLRLLVAAHGAGVGHLAVLGAGSRLGDLAVIPDVMSVGGGAGHIVQTDHIVLLHIVAVQSGIDGLAVFIAQNGHLPVDGEQPPGPAAEALVAGGQGHAVGIGDAGNIIAAALIAILVLAQQRKQHVCRSAVVGPGAAIAGPGQILERRLYTAAFHVQCHVEGQETGILAVPSGNGDSGGDGLLIEPGKLRIGGVIPELFVILGVFRVGQDAVNGDAGVVLGLGHQQGLVGHHGAVAGAEAAVLLGRVPAGDIVGLDAAHVVVVHVPDEPVAVAVGDDLDEGLHIAGDIAAVRVGVADALPVHVLGAHLLHKGKGGGQIALLHGLDGEDDVLAGQHRHRAVIPAGAAGAVQNLHRDGDGPGSLAGQRLIRQHPGHIDHGGIGGHHHILIAGAQQNGGILAVEILVIVPGCIGAEISGGGELDIRGDAAGVDGRAVAGIGQAGLPQGSLQQGLIIHGPGAVGALKEDGIDLGNGQVLPAVVHQLQGQRDGGVIPGHGDGGLVGGKDGGVGLRNRQDGPVAGGPGGGGPQLLAAAVIVVHGALVHAGLQGILGQAGQVGGALHRLRRGDAVRHGVQSGHGLLLVQRNVEQALVTVLGIGGVLVCQHKGGAHGAGGGRGRALLIPLILDGAVGSDAHIVPAAVGGLLHGDGDVRDAGCRQLGPDHGQSVGIGAVLGVIGAGDGFLGGGQLFLGLLLLGRLVLRPDGIEVIRLAVLAAVVPIVALLKGAVDDGAVQVLHLVAVGALSPAGELIALPAEAAAGQGHILAEGRGLIGHGAGGGALVGILDVVLNDVLIVAPLGDQGHLVASEHGVLGNGLAEGAVLVFHIPAVQGLVVRIVALAEIGQAGIDLVRGDGLVRQRLLVAVAVEVDGDALGPVGVHMEAVFGVLRCELIGQGDLAAALCRIVPAVEDIAGALGVLHGAELYPAVGVQDIVIVAAHHAGAGDVLRAVIVQVQGHLHRQAAPHGVQGDGLVLPVGQVLHRPPVGITGRGGAVVLAPAQEAVSRVGEGALGQGQLLVIGSRHGVHLPLAAVGGESNGIGDGRPPGLIGHVPGDDGLRRQLRLAAEPAAEGIALLGGICGQTAANGRVLGHQDGCIDVLAVFQGHGIGVGPHGVQVQSLVQGDGRAVLILHGSVGGGGPAGKDLAGAGEGVGHQGPLAAEDLLGGGVLRAVVGVEGYHQGLTGGEAPQIDAVVIFVAAAVLLVFHGELVALFGVHLQALPVLFTALAVDENRAAQLDGALVVLGLGGDLVRKGQVAVLRKGQGQGAGGIALSGAAGKQDLLAILGADLPGRGAGARVRSHRQPVKILGDGFARREGVDRDQAQDYDQRQQHGENSFLHNFFPFLKFCFSRQSFPSRSKKRARTAAAVRVRALL